MKREDLKEFNLTDEQVQKIMDLHGADLERQKQTITTLTTAWPFKVTLPACSGVILKFVYDL